MIARLFGGLVTLPLISIITIFYKIPIAPLGEIVCAKNVIDYISITLRIVTMQNQWHWLILTFTKLLLILWSEIWQSPFKSYSKNKNDLIFAEQ